MIPVGPPPPPINGGAGVITPVGPPPMCAGDMLGTGGAGVIIPVGPPPYVGGAAVIGCMFGAAVPGGVSGFCVSGVLPMFTCPLRTFCSPGKSEGSPSSLPIVQPHRFLLRTRSYECLIDSLIDRQSSP